MRFKSRATGALCPHGIQTWTPRPDGMWCNDCNSMVDADPPVTSAMEMAQRIYEEAYKSLPPVDLGSKKARDAIVPRLALALQLAVGEGVWAKTIFKCDWPTGTVSYVLARDYEEAIQMLTHPKDGEPNREGVTVPDSFGVRFTKDPPPN
jgi:hypothetical protein